MKAFEAIAYLCGALLCSCERQNEVPSKLEEKDATLSELEIKREIDITNQFGVPYTREIGSGGEVYLRYKLFGTGVETGESGFYANTIQICFDSEGAFAFWEIEYQQL